MLVHTSDVVLVEKNFSDRDGSSFCKTKLACHLLEVAGTCRSCYLANNDATPHVYGSATLGVYFDTSTWIITATSMGVSCFVDSIADKIRLVVELNIRITFG